MNNAGLNVVSIGPETDKPPIMFVHGAWHGAWCWERHFLPYFAENGFKCHALDLRGHGQSPAVRKMRWNRISHYVEDVLTAIARLDRKPFLIGHSMGGFISQHCMKKTNDLAGVGLLATVPYYGAIPVSAKVALRRPLQFAHANLTWSLYPLVKNREHAKHMFLESNVEGEALNRFASQLIDESYWGYVDMLGLDLPGKFAPQIPVHVVGGQLDTLFPPASQRSTADRYGASCAIIEDAPHDLMLSSQWRQAADSFIGWINQLSAR